MTSLALGLGLDFDRPSILGRARDDDGPAAHDHAPRDDRSSHSRLTLDDVITGVWEGLSSHHTVTCPVCSGKMAPRYGSGARPVGGRCQRCGSSLG
jgi:DnaJ-class molecular chaperone